MIKFITGVLVGIILATIGVKGIVGILNKSAPIIDAQVTNVKQIATENSK